MKQFITNKIRSILSGVVSREIAPLIPTYDFRIDAFMGLHQKQLLIQMRGTKCQLNEVGFSVFSESDEDGLLLYIFSKIGFTNNTFVDIGGGKGLAGSNIANLAINHGFSGLIIEGEERNAESLQQAYASQKATKHLSPLIISEFVTVKNINHLIESNGIKGVIDLLSIDIDSIDYWIWDAITVIEPNVVIVEIQCILSEDESKTVPLDFKTTIFETFENKRYGIYNSASLLAFTKLASKKGYRLVATNQLGFNAIFVKNNLAIESLPAISVNEGLDKPFVKWAQEKFGKKTKALQWIQV